MRKRERRERGDREREGNDRERGERRRERWKQVDRERSWLVGFVGFLTSSSTTRLYSGRAPRQSA